MIPLEHELCLSEERFYLKDSHMPKHDGKISHKGKMCTSMTDAMLLQHTCPRLALTLKPRGSSLEM